MILGNLNTLFLSFVIMIGIRIILGISLRQLELVSTNFVNQLTLLNCYCKSFHWFRENLSILVFKVQIIIFIFLSIFVRRLLPPTYFIFVLSFFGCTILFLLFIISLSFAHHNFFQFQLYFSFCLFFTFIYFTFVSFFEISFFVDFLSFLHCYYLDIKK